MLKQLLSTTALVLALSAPAWGQTSTSEDAATGQAQTTEELNTQTTDQPEAAGEAVEGAAEDAAQATEDAAEATEDAAGEAASEAEEAVTGTTETEPAMEEPATGTAETEPAVEEPAMDAATDAATTDTGEAVIAAEEEDQFKAEDLMGMTVVSGEGETIGEVEDLIFDPDEKIAGVVVSVGGFLGIGEKHVGLNWDQAEVQQNPDTEENVILVNLTREELESAPEFKTKEEQQAEEDAAAQQQMQDTAAPEPLPAPDTGTATQ